MPRGIWGLANPDANGTAVPDYAIPDPDADPENAALQLIIRLPAKILHTDRRALVWHAYAAVLAEEHAFQGLGWPDAKLCASMIAAAITRPGAGDVLCNHARDALAGTDGIAWRNRERVARAFVIAATDDK
jgi:hypothetical protein